MFTNIITPYAFIEFIFRVAVTYIALNIILIPLYNSL